MNKVNVLQPQPETASAINWLGNHDLKALGYIGLVVLGEASSTELGDELKETVHPDAYSSVVAYPKTYAKAGFASVFTESSDWSNRSSYYYSAVHEQGALATIGALLEVSDAHDYPLVTALSTTSSKGKSNAPVNTIQILHGIEQGLRLVDMGLPGYKPDKNGHSTTFNSRIKTLLDIGLIQSIDEPVVFRIMEPRYKGVRPFNYMSEGRQGFYHAARTAKETDPDGVWTVEQIEELAQKHNFVNDATEADFKDALMRAISKKLPTYSPGVIEKQELKPRKYVIAEKHAEMVYDLIETVARLDTSPKHAKETRDFAMDAYYTPDMAYRIAERGLTNSKYRRV
jgi:hypothetical protein